MFYFMRNISHPLKVWVCEEWFERDYYHRQYKVSAMIETLYLRDAVAKYGYCEVR